MRLGVRFNESCQKVQSLEKRKTISDKKIKVLNSIITIFRSIAVIQL